MSTEHLEVERKYDAPETLALPDLHDLPGVAAVAQPEEHQLEAIYYDTADLRLAQARITLRRRTGGTDAGWHLKLPTPSGDREELGEPLGEADEVPEALARLVRVHARDQALAPVARVRNRRVVHRLLGPDQVALADVTDDNVTAESIGAEPAAAAWREFEVELVDGERSILDAVGERLESAGAAPSSSQSKLARALGDRLKPSPPPAEGKLSLSAPAGAVVQAYLRQQVEQLEAWDPKVRRDEYDAVHKMRVATRRLRSALATYRPLLNREVTEPLRDELKWLGGALGAPRDAEVMRDRLEATLETEPAELVLGGVGRRIAAEMKSRHQKAHTELLETLDSDRYFRLLDALDELAANPPFTDLAEAPVSEVLSRRVRRTYKRVRGFVDQAYAAPDAEQRGHLLHEARKAAKRARYAGESVSDVYGDPATEFAKRMEDVQDVLGEHQDSVVLREQLRQMGVQAHLDGENAFTFGRLHALEQARADQAERDFEPAWQVARRKKLRAWLR